MIGLQSKVGARLSRINKRRRYLPQILRRCAGVLIGGRVMTQLLYILFQKGIARPYSQKGLRQTTAVPQIPQKESGGTSPTPPARAYSAFYSLRFGLAWRQNLWSDKQGVM